MTKTELRAMVRTLTLLTTNDISDANLDVYLDEAYNRVLRSRTWPWALAETPMTVPLVAGTSTYSLTGVTHVLAVVNEGQRYDLEPISAATWTRMNGLVSSESRPVAFAWASPNLRVLPVPAVAEDLSVYHYEIPEWTDEPPFSPMFHTMLADWSAHRLWEREEEFQRSEQYRMRFEDSLAEMQQFYNTETVARPRIYGDRPTTITPSNMPFLADANLGSM